MMIGFITFLTFQFYGFIICSPFILYFLLYLSFNLAKDYVLSSTIKNIKRSKIKISKINHTCHICYEKNKIVHIDKSFNNECTCTNCTFSVCLKCFSILYSNNAFKCEICKCVKII